MNDRSTHRRWNEETRNQFHPGVILAIIMGQTDLAPFGSKDSVELASHYLGYTREFSEAYMDGDQLIEGFVTRWQSKIQDMAIPLARLYPDLARLGSWLRVRGYFNEANLQPISKARILAEVELKFGLMLPVLPREVLVLPTAVVEAQPIRKKTLNWTAATFKPVGSPIPIKAAKNMNLPPIPSASMK